MVKGCYRDQVVRRWLNVLLLAFCLAQGRTAFGDDLLIDADFQQRGIADVAVLWLTDNTEPVLDDVYTAYQQYRASPATVSGPWRTSDQVEALMPNFLRSAWVAFSITNNQSRSIPLMLSNSFHGTHVSEVFIFRGGQLADRARFGLSVPLDDYRIRHRDFLLPVTLQPGETVDVLLKHSSSSRNAFFETRVATAEYLASHTDTLDLGEWLLHGIYLTLGIICLIIWLVTRQHQYLYFAGFLLFSDLVTLTFSGYAKQLLWTDTPWLSGRALTLSRLGAMWCLFWFNNHFLCLQTSARGVYYLNVGGSLLVVAGIAATVLLDVHYSLLILVLALLLLALVSGVTWLTSALLYRRGLPQGRDYFLVWSLYLAGTAMVLFLRSMKPEQTELAEFLSQLVSLSAAAALVGAMVRNFVQLQRQTAEALAEGRARSVFLAKMSHEIRTPLNGVMGMAELLHNTSLNELQTSYLRTLQRSGQSLVEVINDILDFSKLEAGRMRLESIAFSLPELLQDVADNFSYRLRDTQVVLLCDYDFQLPEMLIGDPLRLRQILLNLVSNALKYTHQGEVVITVRATDRARLAIAVRDTGIGIDQRQLGLLFKAFSQADVSTTRLYGGTGLGLAICKQLVDMMQGEIGVESTPGQGSTFWVELPLEPAPDAAPAQNWQQLLEKLRSLRLLFIDDNETSRDIYRTWLTGYGIEGDICATTTEFLQRAADAARAGQSYDLAVLDLHLPGDNGLALADRLRALPGYQHTTVILLTATGIPPDHDTLARHGIDYASHMPVIAAGLLKIFRAAFKLAPAPTAPPRPLSASPDRKLHVLIAEDNAVNAAVLTGMLNQLGHSSLRARDGHQALDMLRNADPAFDVVLMDCEMPELDGYETCRRIRAELASNLPVVAVTAHILPDEHQRCIDAGMNRVLTKPLSMKDLAQTLNDLLAH